MRCPLCGRPDSKVLDSRSSNGGRVVRRRRACLSCERRFTTREFVEETPLVVRKGDGRRETFDREKIRKGVQLACIKRPISTETIEKLVESIELRLRDRNDAEINSLDIGREVMKALRRLDDIAYVRFASVYRKFQDKEEFISELRGLDQEA